MTPDDTPHPAAEVISSAPPASGAEPRLTSLGPDHPDYVAPEPAPDSRDTIKDKIAGHFDAIMDLLNKL